MPSFPIQLQTCNNQQKIWGNGSNLGKGQQAMSPTTNEYNSQQVAMIDWQGLRNSKMMEHDVATRVHDMVTKHNNQLIEMGAKSLGRGRRIN